MQKNAKNGTFFWKERMPNPGFWPSLQTICLKWQCHENFGNFSFSWIKLPPGPLINRQKWFCWKICFRGDIQLVWQCLKIQTCWRYVEIVPIFKIKKYILHQGKERPAISKLMPAKLHAVLAFRESDSAQY